MDAGVDRTVAVQVRDCARIRRVAYVRNEALSLPELAPLIVGEPTVHRFSTFLDGAQDAWSAELIGGAHATGVIGGRTVLVTYGKLGNRSADAQSGIEGWLVRRYGPLLSVPSLVEAERWFEAHAVH